MKPHSDDHSEHPSRPEDNWLDRALQDSASDYIADAGFTAQVMSFLPAPRRKFAWRRPALIGGATVLGCLLAFLLGGSPLTASLRHAFQWVAEESTRPIASSPFNALIITTLVFSGLVSWLALSKAAR